ncbi:MAG: VWA domain-containing protein [Planctomycetota bacterium]|nr:MAG: VWA domain-containing protein [Planctomycetota bacterium]
MLCTLLLLAAQDLEGIERTLKQAVDKNSYENGAYQAAKTLADMRSAAAMELRLKLFDPKMDTYRGVYLRDWFYSGMKKAERIEESALLIKAARDKKRSELQRVLCLRALTVCKAPIPAKEMLQRSFLKATPVVQREWQQCLGTAHAQNRLYAEGKLATELDLKVRELLAKAGPPYNGLSALRSLAAPEWGRLLGASRDAKHPWDRAEALRGLAAHMNKGPFLQAVEWSLADKEWAPKIAAVEASVINQAYGSVPLFIDALELAAKEKNGRLQNDLGIALMRLTQQQLGFQSKRWRQWWQDQGREWLQKANDGLIQRPGQAEKEAETTSQIFGLPVHSHRICLLVDASGSMKDPFGDTTRAEAAAKEMEEFLQQLPAHAKVNLIMIDQRPKLLFKKLSPANAGNRRKILQQVRKNEYRQRSALVNAIELASSDLEVDTLVLIGDGGSSEGIHQYSGHMLEYLGILYRRSGVRIHTISVGGGTSKTRFMQQLAEATGGHSVVAEAP